GSGGRVPWVRKSRTKASEAFDSAIGARVGLERWGVKPPRERRMLRSWKSFGLMALVASAALLPLYGDARPSPVSHPEWARMILRALDLLEPGAGAADQASQVFSTLSGKGSRAFRDRKSVV